MTLGDLRKAVRAFNVMLVRGSTTHAQPMYGRNERGYTDSVGDRELPSSSSPVRKDELLVTTFEFDPERKLFREQPFVPDLEFKVNE